MDANKPFGGAQTTSMPDKAQDVSGMRPTRPVTVFIADDHPVVREGLAALIGRCQELRMVGEAGDGQEAVEQFCAQRPDVALVDLRMPVMDGVEVVTRVREKIPTARLVILTTYQSEEDVYRALQAGAQGYILKDAPASELIECIRAVGSGKTWIPPGVGERLARRVTQKQLTPREMEVLRTMAAGKSNKEIGAAFNISEATVKVHVTHLLEKLEASGRTEAIRVAVNRGLVRLDSNPAA
jgi:DNA-binding NarL/FixJ family response regulator